MGKMVTLVSRASSPVFSKSGLKFQNHRCTVTEDQAKQLRRSHPLWNREFGLEGSFKIKAHQLRPQVVRASSSDVQAAMQGSEPIIQAVHGVKVKVDRKKEAELFGEKPKSGSKQVTGKSGEESAPTGESAANQGKAKSPVVKETTHKESGDDPAARAEAEAAEAAKKSEQSKGTGTQTNIPPGAPQPGGKSASG